MCIVLREGNDVRLHAVAAESPQLAELVRARYNRRGLQFAADLAARAIAAGEDHRGRNRSRRPRSRGPGPGGNAARRLPCALPAREGAILVYPRADGAFSQEEKSLLSAVAGFGAVAIANAELYGTARAQAQELHQLLDILSELGPSAIWRSFCSGS